MFVSGHTESDTTVMLSPPTEGEYFTLCKVLTEFGGRGGTVVKVLCYKSEGRWFDPRWFHWNFSLT